MSALHTRTTVNGKEFVLPSKYRVIKAVRSVAVAACRRCCSGAAGQGSSALPPHCLTLTASSPPRRRSTAAGLSIPMQIGSGAYGVVASGEDTSNGARVAIKMIPNVFK